MQLRALLSTAWGVGGATLLKLSQQKLSLFYMSSQFYSKIGYQEYLKSSHWIDFKDKIYSRRRQCEFCKINYGLNIHHLTYERLGAERTTDVMVLCRNCHYKHHEGKITSKDLAFARKHMPIRYQTLKKKKYPKHRIYRG
jgi:cytochrome c